MAFNTFSEKREHYGDALGVALKFTSWFSILLKAWWLKGLAKDKWREESILHGTFDEEKSLFYKLIELRLTVSRSLRQTFNLVDEEVF